MYQNIVIISIIICPTVSSNYHAGDNLIMSDSCFIPVIVDQKFVFIQFQEFKFTPIITRSALEGIARLDQIVLHDYMYNSA